ncbi:MAG: hypothetical protein AMXMBFR58_00270 [Phycisphaerae bacterium]
MRLFKTKYRDRSGRSKTAPKWYVEFRDQRDITRRLPAFSSKSASEELGKNLDRLVSYHVATAGQTDPTLQGWLADLPKAIRRRLLEIGLIDSERVSMSKPLSEHVADFRKALESKGNTTKHVEATCTRITRIFEECRFTFWPQITGTKVQSFLNGLREGEEKLSPQTFNYYLGSLKSFCRWMVKNRRATTSPVSHIDPLNVKTDRRHDRRALSPEELLWLLSATAEGEPRSSMTGFERAMLYRVAIETGLRANEIRSLTTASFALDTDPPTVTVSAAYSKHRREDVLPIRPALARDLTAYFDGAEKGKTAFAIPSESRVAGMLRGDLAAAREAWIADATTDAEREERRKSEFLLYRDSAGKVADFQALRHTFITCLATGGVHPKTAQTLARHSTITLTMDRYSHTLKGAEVEALKALPEIPTSRARAAHAASRLTANGQNVLASCLAQNGTFRDSGGDRERRPSEPGAAEPDDAKTAQNTGDFVRSCEAHRAIESSSGPWRNGRRGGLKIRCRASGVWVRFPPGPLTDARRDRPSRLGQWPAGGRGFTHRHIMMSSQ